MRLRLEENKMSQKYVLVYVTFPNSETALSICRLLVEEKLIACANILPPHTSLYEWNNEIKQETETGALLKTRKKLFEALQQRILSLHPYDCPCIAMISLKNGHADFLNWIQSQTQDL